MKTCLLPITFLLVAGCTTSTPSETTPAEVTHGKCDVVLNYDIDLPRFDETAQQIAHATGCFIQTDLQRTGAVKPQPVQGRYSPRQAVAKAIEGTGLSATVQQPDLIVVE